MILVDSQGEDFPFTNGNLTMEEPDFLLRHKEEIPATMEKLEKEESKKRKKNNRKDRKKEV